MRTDIQAWKPSWSLYSKRCSSSIQLIWHFTWAVIGLINHLHVTTRRLQAAINLLDYETVSIFFISRVFTLTDKGYNGNRKKSLQSFWRNYVWSAVCLSAGSHLPLCTNRKFRKLSNILLFGWLELSFKCRWQTQQSDLGSSELVHPRS